MRQRNVFITALAAVLALGACSSGSSAEAIEEWCSIVEDAPALLAAGNDALDTDFDTDLGSFEETLDELQEFERTIQAQAPPEIADEVQLMWATDTTTVRIEEQEAYEEASDKVNDFIRDKCGLDVQL